MPAPKPDDKQQHPAPTTPPPDPDQAALDAEAQRLAEEAERERREAAETSAAAQKAAEAAEDAEIGGRVRRCPHCRGVLVKHDDANPLKAGASHCDACGTCWAPGLRTPRDGTPAPAGWKE